MKRTLGIGLAVIFLSSATVCAQTTDEASQHAAVEKSRLAKELNLTAEQQKKLEENRKTQRDELVKLLTAIKEKEVELQKALKSPEVTRASVDPLVSSLKSLQAQLIDGRISRIFTLKELLTPEQFAKFQQIAEKQQEIRKERLHDQREKKKGADQNR
ncbi:MAG TPA: periplasmic heavy metal sensor [Patescibacteria group bacterium]|nr:periplasmic heavy metal sensor [Patescibacteria group bacterium]